MFSSCLIAKQRAQIRDVVCSNLWAPTLDILCEAEEHVGSVLVAAHWGHLVMPACTGLFLKHCQTPPWSTTETVPSTLAPCSPFLSSKTIPRCPYFLISGDTVLAADALLIALGSGFLCLQCECSLGYPCFVSHFVVPAGNVPEGWGWIRSRDHCCSVCKHCQAKISRAQKNHL